ncbi:MAG: VanW family protein [Patescibacteria group bacterium]
MTKKKAEENKMPEEEKYTSTGSRIFPPLLVLFCFLLAGTIMIEILYDARISPNTFLGNTSLSNVPYEKLGAKVEQAIKKFELRPIVFSLQGKKVNVRASQIGLQWDVKKFLERKNVVKKPFQKTAHVVASLFQKRQEKIEIAADWDELENILKKEFGIEETRDAFLEAQGKKIIIVDEKEGFEIDHEKLQEKVSEFVGMLGGKTNKGKILAGGKIELDIKKFEPKIVKKDLEEHFVELEKLFTKIVTIQIKDVKTRIALRNYRHWISYKKEEGKIKVDLDDDALTIFLKNEFSKDADYPANPISIFRDENSKIIFDGTGKNGQAVQYEEAEKLVESAFNTDAMIVEVPVQEIPAEVNVSQDLQDIGIKELITVGYTTYYGSPVNRMFNIQNGIGKFNGRIISPGEEFSFNSVLGRVDGSTGYRKELVIKPEGTIPEYGGGICQVSTTMYRAALSAGLPIINRKPHSYLVSYYAQVGGHGLDATIYPGSSDLKFINDTPGSILVQSYADGQQAYFKFYGTKDGRKVEIEGPQISNHTSAGSVEYIKTTSLPPGTQKQVEKAHNGFTTRWHRTITSATGEVKKEEIISKYKAIPSRILVGSIATEIKPGDPTGEQYFRD